MCLIFDCMGLFQAVFLKIGVALGGRALACALLKLGLAGGLALGIGFWARVLITGEVSEIVGPRMMATGSDSGNNGSGSWLKYPNLSPDSGGQGPENSEAEPASRKRSADPREDVGPSQRPILDLNLPPAPESEPDPPAPRGPDEPGGAEGEHPQRMGEVERALFQLDVAKRDTLKQTLEEKIGNYIQNEFIPRSLISKGGAPAPKDCVNGLIQKWGDIYGRGEGYLNGNSPQPSRDNLRLLNKRLQQAINGLNGKKGPELEITRQQIAEIVRFLSFESPNPKIRRNEVSW